MRKTVEKENARITFDIGLQNESIYTTLIVTNTSSETIRTSSGMGKWGSITITDENDVERLESVGSTAAVTHWTIDPQKCIVYQRESCMPSEALELWTGGDMPDNFNYTVNPIESLQNDDVYFAPNIDVVNESDHQFTAKSSVGLKNLETEFECTFTITELSDPISLDNLDIMDSAREKYMTS